MGRNTGGLLPYISPWDTAIYQDSERRLSRGPGLSKRRPLATLTVAARAARGPTKQGQAAFDAGLYFEAPEPRAFIRAFIADVRHLSYALEPGIP